MGKARSQDKKARNTTEGVRRKNRKVSGKSEKLAHKEHHQDHKKTCFTVAKGVFGSLEAAEGWRASRGSNSSGSGSSFNPPDPYKDQENA